MTHTIDSTGTTSTSDTTSTEPPALVVSCSAYVVTQVGGRPPTALEEFAGLTDFVAEGLTGSHHVSGQGGEVVGDTVRFYEKDNHGTGKDVRVWTVCRRDAGFLATC